MAVRVDLLVLFPNVSFIPPTHTHVHSPGILCLIVLLARIIVISHGRLDRFRPLWMNHTIVLLSLFSLSLSFEHINKQIQRGMGEGATGSSISLIAPAEDRAHGKIVESLNVAFTKTLLDGRLLAAAQERTNLASKILCASELENKTNSSNRWFLDRAREAELDLDDDLMEDDSNRPEKELQQLREAQKAKVRLAQLLAEPMKTQRYGKFLSTNSAAMQSEVKPLVVQNNKR